MNIVIAMNPSIFESGSYRDPRAADAIYGAGWVPYFCELAEDKGFEVVSAKEAIDQRRIAHRVIQEELNPLGRFYTGTVPGVLICAESPLFTPDFYDELPKIRRHYSRQMLFNSGTDHMHFPSFHPHEIKPVGSWSDRKPLCMISANKHYGAYGIRATSPARMFSLTHQLHDLRFKAIESLVPMGHMDLYGYGWPEAFGRTCENKIDTLSNYKFSLVIENVRMPGYVTEKLIHCLVAGTIPIYYGAPDVAAYIPPECYVALDSDWLDEGMAEMIANFPEERAIEIVKAGRDFLSSPEGLRYSHFGFATEMLAIVEQA